MASLSTALLSWQRSPASKPSSIRLSRAVLLLVVLVAVCPARAASVQKTRLPDGSWKVTISGLLQQGDQARYARLISKASGVSSVHLDSPGGLVDEGYAFGREIQDEGLTTVVERGAHCESACFIIFVAGNRKIASIDAKIGIHRGSLNGVDSEDGTREVLESIYRLANLDTRTYNMIADHLHKTSSGSMTYIPENALRAIGVEIWR